MLARRPYSVAEMRRALEKKFPGNQQVQEAITRLRELGYLDDRKFAEQTAHSLAQNRAFGPHRIRRELKARLVDYKYVDPAVEHTFAETSEPDLLQRALEKKVRSLRPPITPRKLHSLCQSLLRRGFRTGDIIKAIRSRAYLQPVSEGLSPVDLEETTEQG